jgi:hypothetical protein
MEVPIGTDKKRWAHLDSEHMFSAFHFRSCAVPCRVVMSVANSTNHHSRLIKPTMTARHPSQQGLYKRKSAKLAESNQ